MSRWYAGTADAVFQNIHLLEEERPRHVLIVSGDHVYRMDYTPLIQFHLERDADLTMACTQVPLADATRMGVLAAEPDGRVCGFAEKPAQPQPLPYNPERALVSMGVYVFKTESLVRALIADAKQETKHDFGRNIIPAMASRQHVYAYDVISRCTREQHYWQDVGTLDSYFEANLNLLLPAPPFDLFRPDWPVRTYSGQHPPALMRNAGEREARAANSIVSSGCIVAGGSVIRCVLSPKVFVGPGAIVDESILMPAVKVGDGSRIRRAIVDENVVIAPHMQIGWDLQTDRRRFEVTEGGVVVVPEGTVPAQL